MSRLLWRGRFTVKLLWLTFEEHILFRHNLDLICKELPLAIVDPSIAPSLVPGELACQMVIENSYPILDPAVDGGHDHAEDVMDAVKVALAAIGKTANVEVELETEPVRAG